MNQTLLAILISILVSQTGIVMAQNKFAEADSIALQSNGQTVVEIHHQLTGHLQNDEEKVRAFFTWIANNIQYDFRESRMEEKSHVKQEPATVIKSRKAICHGYSALFAEFCSLSGIPCHLVSGFTRFNNKYDNTGHTWNVVYLNNEWKPVDITWGAGGIDDHGRYVRDFADRYFLTDPVEFLSSHYPFDPMWQLVTMPVKLQQYKRSDWIYEKNDQTFFSFSDTITTWLKLDSVEQEFTSAMRMQRYGGDEPKILQQVSYSWFNKGNTSFENGNRIMSVLYPRAKKQQVTKTENWNKEEKKKQLISIDKFYKEADYFYRQVQFSNPADKAILKNNTDALKYNRDVVRKELAATSK